MREKFLEISSALTEVDEPPGAQLERGRLVHFVHACVSLLEEGVSDTAPGLAELYETIEHEAGGPISLSIKEEYRRLSDMSYGQLFNLYGDLEEQIESAEAPMPNTELIICLIRIAMAEQKSDFQWRVSRNEIDLEAA